jgi:hypothetical protein
LTPFDYTILPMHDLAFLLGAVIASPVGDIVVAGTYAGGDVMLIQDFAPYREVIVVDSFEGLAEPTAGDEGGKHAAGEFHAGGLAQYRENFATVGQKPPERIHSGFITREFLATIPLDRVALAWLDLDHYQPTLDCFYWLGPAMVPGGLILCHDYGNVDTPGVTKAFADFSEPEAVFGSVAVLRKKIVSGKSGWVS